MTLSKSNLIVYKKQFSCQVTARGEQYQTYKCSKSSFFLKTDYSIMLELATLNTNNVSDFGWSQNIKNFLGGARLAMIWPR